MTPIIWSIAGTDSGGGAGLAADQRAADALGVHCCTVVAGITAQSTVEVTHIEATPPAVLQAQLDTLAADMPPSVIKTGLLGSVDNVRLLARFVDRLREQRPLALVVDPVLRASTGAALADAELRAAYRELLVPRATVITPNQSEAVALLEGLGDACPSDIPAQAQALRAMGCEAVVITGGDAAAISRHASLSLDWLDAPHAQGWLSLPRENIPHNHGTGCTFASALAAALAIGWVVADAAVLAKMAATFALRHARAVGRGVGPVVARAGFARQPSLLPHLSIGSEPPSHEAAPPRGRPPGVWAAEGVESENRPQRGQFLPNLQPHSPAMGQKDGEKWTAAGGLQPTTLLPPRLPGVYAIVESAERAEAVLRARPTVNTLQLRMKRPDGMTDSAWAAHLTSEVQRSLRAADEAGVTLVVNDHWQLALAAGARALHLGQQDLLDLSPADRAQLQAARRGGVQLGLSSHSLWELCRASALQPDLIACGPVWPTTTKDMPWLPQGLDNLAWWVQMAPAPVVGIGGILAPDQLRAVAATGAAGGCVVRGLSADPAAHLAPWLEAWRAGQAARDPAPAPDLPHPSLPA